MVETRNKDFFVMNYMHDFHCIGTACGEDHCCQEWNITIDHDNYKKLKKVMEKDPAGQKQFKQRVKRTRSSANSDRLFATFILDETTRHCQFLDEQGLCDIHGRFGAEYLCDTCRMYPRKINVFPDRVEMSAQLSCPEVGRLCLLQAGSTELEAADPSQFPIAGLDPCNDTRKLNSLYASYVHDLRKIFCDFLSLDNFPLGSRLFFLSYLANRCAEFYKQGSQFEEKQLADEIDRIATPQLINDLHDGYQTLGTDLQIPLSLISALLSASGQTGLPPKLFAGIAQTYGLGEQLAGTDSPAADTVVSVGVDEIMRTYTERQQKLVAACGGRLDFILTNFCKNHIISTPYTDSKDLLHAMHGLLARLTTLNFLLISDPRINPLLTEGSPGLDEKTVTDTIDAISVDVVYKFSRTLEHNKGVWDRVFSEADSSNLAVFAVLSQLLKFSTGDNL